MRMPVRVLVSCLLSFALHLSSSAVAVAQPAQPADWRQSLPGATGAALGQAANGDVVVAGIESPSPYDASYGATLVLQRYAGDGSVVWPTPVRWTSIAAGVRPVAVRVDGAGNTFVLASIADYNFVVCVPEVSPCTGPVTLFNAWWSVQKYSATGTLLWERRQLQVGFVPVAGSVDAAGDLYVALDPNSAGRTTVVTRLAGATGATTWSATTPDAAKPGGLALTSSGTVVVAGASVLGLSINEYAAIDGVRLARTLYPAAAGSYAPGLALGAQGQIAVTGASASGLFVALESAARQPLFATAVFPGAEGRQVAVDGAGNVVVAGVIPGATGTNWLLMRFNPLGNALHAPIVFDRHNTALEAPRDLALTADGAAYVTGAAGPPPTTDASLTQAVTLRLSTTGTIDWIATEAGSVRGLQAAVDANGDVAVVLPGAMTLVHYAARVVVPPPTPSALSLSATSVRGGNRVTGTVTLSSNTGAIVSIASSHPTIASVPGSIVVAAGQATGRFTITTSKVRTTTAVTITVTANGVSRSAILTVLK